MERARVILSKRMTSHHALLKFKLLVSFLFQLLAMILETTVCGLATTIGSTFGTVLVK